MSRWIVHAAAGMTASHALVSYMGEPESLHTHRWRVAVRVAVEKLNAEGYSLDFHGLRGVLEELVIPLDGACLNDHPEIGQPSPTAERLALYLAERLTPAVEALGGELLTVSVWEGPGNRVDLELAPILHQGS